MINYRITAATDEVPDAPSKMPILTILALMTDLIGIPIFISEWQYGGLEGLFAIVIGVPILLLFSLLLGGAGCARREPWAVPVTITLGFACFCLLAFMTAR